MRIFLPPSAAKTAGSGPPLAFDKLSYQEFSPHRRRIVAAVEKAAARPDALDVFGVSPRLGDEVAAMIGLGQAPTGPAGHVMSGVLYAAAGYPNRSTAELGSAATTRIVTDLFGFVRLTDPIPAYRAAMTTHLEGIGALGASWRSALREQVLTDPDPFVLSCCSAPYAAAWMPTTRQLERAGVHVIAVRPVVSTPQGLRSISHWAKHLRGRLAGALGGQAHALDSPDALMSAISSLASGDIIDAFLEGSGPVQTLNLVTVQSS